ncbi:radical SAM protein [Micromonospora sp. HUAS LYJ1]|uniref:B12-binding domain-containing radical SAM protein n=1 Tax=Micromonospora sp. HUAS LYJ1 TaxID=3061626 RepID=UPI0026741C08|nr:radical SAM protein [Micromonospora sp. HUAS LYJ1]WKU08662.1 radical SAM protein [Micromonospora sp. HUAS LYJ1]
MIRLLRPRMLLVALYHPEWFPLPRFPLAISDLARAARATLLGQIRLMDMQLGVTLPDVRATVDLWQPDIVGVSATFGQHDLMVNLIDHLSALPTPPLVVAGGSLTARNEGLLLDRYPNLLVARGAGEPTIADVLSHYHGDLRLPEIRGIGYRGAPRGGGLAIARQRTMGVTNRAQTDFLPELDLLDATLDHRGVAQLEASRGCTNFCSFCPRGHKGTWAGGNTDRLDWIIKEMGEVFDRHPEVSRTLYLVDEEAIGAGPDAAGRVKTLAETIHAAGFHWESSCRVDQVVDPTRDRTWHVERADMWRHLVAHGLRRMLFGVESGVTSILERFNKETTGEQNALAIRTLSALGVPTRFTYITFDQLMNASELTETHRFQARTDLLLQPLPQLSVADIIDGVRDDAFVAEHSTGRPFYTAISYMLVSMECLTGAAYTRRVQTVGLAGAARPSLGRIDARFADWRIGVCSRNAQLWIDRHFALDYTLKSLEKILDGGPRHHVRHARVIMKDAAFTLLTAMLTLIDTTSVNGVAEDFEHRLRNVMDEQLAALDTPMSSTVEALIPQLPADSAAVLQHELHRWQHTEGWRLINAAEACGA